MAWLPGQVEAKAQLWLRHLRWARFYVRADCYITCELKSKTKIKWGVYLSCISVKAGSPPQPLPSIKEKKKIPNRSCTLWTLTGPKHKPFPFERLSCFCAVTAHAAVCAAWGTPGASALTEEGNRIVFCLFSCYVVLKCNFLFMRY